MTRDEGRPSQRRVFLDSEGDGYFGRNPILPEDIEVRAGEDPIVRAVTTLGLAPSRILEIGASQGWRLAWFKTQFPDAECVGLDPSAEAVAAGTAAHPDITLHRGTAEHLPFEDGAFDLVIYGFCLYLCDRQDLFRIAAEGDRVLAEEGALAIFDFTVTAPRRNPYAHVPGLHSYKLDYPQMFLWNPAYRVLLHEAFPHKPGEAPTEDNMTAISVLRRRTEGAYDATDSNATDDNTTERT